MKQQWRSELRARRRALAPAERADHDAAICAAIIAHFHDRATTTVAGYWSHDGEPELTVALAALHGGGHRIALPVVGADNHMSFRRWTPACVMAPNRFGIPEPVDQPDLGFEAIDHVLLPLVAFDGDGHRLGMGAGFYDRWFTDHLADRRPRRIGVAYALQRVPVLPRDAWDVPLHAVVTEDGWLPFADQGQQEPP